MDEPRREPQRRTISSFAEAQLLRLPQSTLRTGLSAVIIEEQERLTYSPELDRISDGERNFRAMLLEAVYDLIDPHILKDFEGNEVKYKQTMRRTLAYLRFLGLAPMLSPKLIVEKAQLPEELLVKTDKRGKNPANDDRSLRETDKMAFKPDPALPSPARKKLRDGVLQVVEQIEEEEQISERGYTDRTLRKASYNFLDEMMRSHTVLPKYKELYTTQIEENAKKIQSELPDTAI